MLRHCFLIGERAQYPRASGACVGQRLQRSERLGAHHKEGFGGLEVAHRLDEIGAVNVGDETHHQVALAIVTQRLVGHHRAEVGTADTDVDHVADALAGMAGPGPAAHAFGERRHAIEHRVHFRHDVPAFDEDALARRCPQRDMQHCALLGDVDPVAAKHRLDPLGETAGAGELPQQAQRRAGDALLGIV
jgi:hypothetical protein